MTEEFVPSYIRDEKEFCRITDEILPQINELIPQLRQLSLLYICDNPHEYQDLARISYESLYSLSFRMKSVCDLVIHRQKENSQVE